MEQMNSSDLCLYRLILRGALDYFERDASAIATLLAEAGRRDLALTMDTIESALLALRHLVEGALSSAG